MEKIRAVIATADSKEEGLISKKYYTEAEWSAIQAGEVIQDGLNSAGVVYIPGAPDYGR